MTGKISGPSGCGKTTLLRIIGGFEQPTNGDVLIGGKSALADPPYRRRTNMIFQHLALFPHLTAAQNIAFGLEVKKLPRADVERKVKESPRAGAACRLRGAPDRRAERRPAPARGDRARYRQRSGGAAAR